MKIQLPKTKYVEKDQKKSDLATKFIGRGTPGSSTDAYRIAWGELANCGEYTCEDVVFVSANGRRSNALLPPYKEIQRAIDAGAEFVIDGPKDRNRPYNSGERLVAQYLRTKGYVEYAPGLWREGP